MWKMLPVEVHYHLITLSTSSEKTAQYSLDWPMTDYKMTEEVAFDS